MNKRIWSFVIFAAVLFMVWKGYQLDVEQKNKDNPFPTSSPNHSKIEKFGQLMMEDKELKAYFVTAKSPQEYYQMATEAAQKGKMRLKDGDLEERVRIVASIIDEMDEENCANLVAPIPALDPQAQGRKIIVLFDKLPPSDFDAFFSFTYKSALAEVRKDPLIINDPNMSKNALEVFLGQISKNDAERLKSVLNKPTASRSDVCWASRIIYKNVLSLKQPEKSVMIRDLSN